MRESMRRLHDKAEGEVLAVLSDDMSLVVWTDEERAMPRPLQGGHVTSISPTYGCHVAVTRLRCRSLWRRGIDACLSAYAGSHGGAIRYADSRGRTHAHRHAQERQWFANVDAHAITHP